MVPSQIVSTEPRQELLSFVVLNLRSFVVVHLFLLFMAPPVAYGGSQARG